MTTLNRALTDRNLLGAALGSPLSWRKWLSVLRAAYALPLSPADLVNFNEVAGGRKPPSKRVNQLWCTIGRRSGKSTIAAALAVYTATFLQHKLAYGEVGCALILAGSLDQSKAVFDHCRGFLTASPILNDEIAAMTKTEIRLKNGNIIAVHPNSYRTVRSRTLLCCVFDEVSIWQSEGSALPDVETYRAVLPSLITTNGMLIGISSPYRKIGLLYDMHRKHFGQDSDDVLVIQGASRTFNPTLDEAVIKASTEADPEAAVTEWEGHFRSDLSNFLDDETIEACVDHARPLEIPPRISATPGLSDRPKRYQAFIDVSGGRHDHFTICIGHREGKDEGAYFVVDVVRGRAPPFDPEDVVAEYAKLLKEYNVSQVTGDSYSEAWNEVSFRRHGIRYVPSELKKSELYLEALPQFMRRAISLPNHPRLIRELRQLERKPGRTRDIIDHPRREGGSDDYANVVCGALKALAPGTGMRPYNEWVGSDVQQEEENKCGKQNHAAAMLSAYFMNRGYPF